MAWGAPGAPIGMRPQRLRQVQRGLLAGGVLVLVALGWSLRRPPREDPPPPTLPPGVGQKGQGQTLVGELTELKGTDERVRVRFGKMTGSDQGDLELEGVELTFRYTAEGQPATGKISADGCRYTPSLQRAVFRGNVVLTTEDGFELRSPTLSYRGDRGVLKSEERVEFKRKDTSGSALGFSYEAEEGRAEFPAEPRLRIQDDQGPPTEIEGGRAEFDKPKGELRFLEGARAARGADLLVAQKLTLRFAADRRAINSLEAFDDVVLTMSGAQAGVAGLPGGSGGGRRELRAPALNLWFRPDRTAEEASAFFDAQLTVWPGARERREKRTLRSRVMVFRFDAQGRLEELQGQKTASFLREPLPPDKGEPQALEARNFVARFDSATGEMAAVDARGDVDYRHGLRHASAERGTFDAGQGRLALFKGRPTLEEQGTSRLTAERIEIATPSGDVEARGGAQQSLFKGGAAPGLVGGAAGGDQPTLITSRTLSYEARTRTTLYDGAALMRSGRSEVRAERLRQVEDAQGRRRIEAEGGVSSRLQPGAGKAGGQEPALVEVKAQAMVYDEAQKQVVYTGDVDLRQGPISTFSPRATLFLAADGRALEKLVAGEPVRLKEGQRRADGRLATYDLTSETITIEGEPVHLLGPGQDVQGRSLTFHVGDDRILVDGREEGRTETVFRKEPARP